MKLGFIGTGKITSSVINGICKSSIKFDQIIISERNRLVSKSLKKRFKKIKIEKEVETGKHGTQKYVIKQGENKGKIV